MFVVYSLEFRVYCSDQQRGTSKFPKKLRQGCETRAVLSGTVGPGPVVEDCREGGRGGPTCLSRQWSYSSRSPNLDRPAIPRVARRGTYEHSSRHTK